MSNQLLPCPFCNAAMSIESNHDWHRIVGEHDERCLFMDRETVTVPATDEQLALAVRDWNRRATQPAAGEPVRVVAEPGEELSPSNLVGNRIDRMLTLGTRLYTAPPAAAYGDEAVQYRLLRVGEVIKATDEVLMDDCTTWHPVGDGPQIGIGWGWHAGLMPVRRIDAAMRAQGDREVQ